jgi:hypothetical protein
LAVLTAPHLFPVSPIQTLMGWATHFWVHFLFFSHSVAYG